MTRHLLALAAASGLLVALPWLVLSDAPAPRVSLAAIDDRPLVPAPAATIDAVLDRAPFRLGDTAAGPPDDPAIAEGDAEAPPQVVGIAGRLPDRAVVLVRRSAGGTRLLAIGEAAGRWRLVSIAADAALFSDGARRVRVELPLPEAPQ